MLNFAQTYAVLSWVVAVLLVTLLIPMRKTNNIALLSAIFWYVQGVLLSGVKAWIWSDNVEVKAEVFCDVALALRNCIYIGLETCSLCIAMQLHSIFSRRRGHIYPKYRVPFEIFMCFAVPCIYEVFSFIVQPSRFVIYEGIGCYTPVYWSLPAIFLIIVPLFFVSVIITIYAVMSVYWFVRHRAQLAEFMDTNTIETIHTRSQWIRLGAFLVLESTVCLGVSIWVIIRGIESGPPEPWISWDHVHANFDEIPQIPRSFLTQGEWNQLWGENYLLTACGLAFFCLLGFSREAMRAYVEVGSWMLNVLSGSRRRSTDWRLPAPSDLEGTGGSVKPMFKIPSASYSSATTDSQNTSINSTGQSGSNVHVIDIGLSAAGDVPTV